MTELIIKPKLTKEYISSKNILSLCYSKIINKDITNIIKSYLIEYKHGFALFENKRYTFNNIKCHENLGGHPFPCIIRFMSKYNYFNNTNLEFNKILDNINNTPNHKKIDLTECIYYLKLNNINIRKLNIACNPNAILDMIVPYIDNTNNNYKSMILYKCNNTSETIQFNYLYICDRQQNNLETMLIENSHYNIALNMYNDNPNIYIKKLIMNNNILTFVIDRTYIVDNIHRLTINKYKLIIPKILDLPVFVFHNNDKKKYILVAVILFDYIYDNKLGFSIVIKNNNNDEYYHYLFNKIYIINDDFFEQNINYTATHIFYKQI